MSWQVDLETALVTHPAGWAFKFSVIDGDPTRYDGECVGQPKLIGSSEDLEMAARIAREAGEAYLKARKARH